MSPTTVASALSVAEAVARVMASIAAVDTESVPLHESLGRVLAEDVTAPAPLPRWDNSAMDGYAVRAADVAGASLDRPRVLTVTGAVRAGERSEIIVGVGEAVRVMTGGAIPAGADSVVRVEDTDGGSARVSINRDRDAGANVRPAGQDVAAGGVAVEAGTQIGPAQLALLAAVGRRAVPVYRRPRVAILCTGDELLMVEDLEGDVLPDDRIVSANSYSLQALVTSNGAAALQLGIATDDPKLIAERVQQCAVCDLLITSGGVSMGVHDHTRAVMDSLGVTDSFWRVRMRPGGPIAFGRLGDVPWLGLPGNPVSAMVTFEIFARPVIRKLAGSARPFRLGQPVQLEERVKASAPLTHFLRAIVTTGSDGRRTARLTGHQGSGLLTSMAAANALLVLPEGRECAEAGETLNALTLQDESQHAADFRL